MKKLIIFSIVLVALTTSCRSLTSMTTIEPNNSFILGNNEHAAYSVNLQNTSSKDITVYKAPIAGGTHSPQVVKPRQKVTVNVEKNTALIVENKSTKKVDVALKIVGDTNLSMGYKSQN
jgi:hypothetical protein